MMPTENTQTPTPVAETSATPVAIQPAVPPDPATTFNQVPSSVPPSRFRELMKNKKFLYGTVFASLLAIVLIALAVFALTRPADTTGTTDNTPTTNPPVAPPPVTDNQASNPSPTPTPTPALVPINGQPTDQRVLTDNRNSLYIGTAMNTVTGKEETGFYYYQEVQGGIVPVTGIIHFPSYYTDSINISQVKNRKLLHVFDQSTNYSFYDADLHDGKTVAISMIKNSNNFTQAVNEVFLIDTVNMKIAKVWEKQITSNKYAPNNGAASPDMASTQSNAYLYLNLAICYACDAAGAKGLVVVNTVTGKEVYLGQYGDPQIDLVSKKVTAKAIVTSKEPCSPGPYCDNGQRDVFKPTGASKTFDLP